MITPRRLLIIKPSSLGDVATCLPLLCDLRAHFPTAQIDWMVSPAFSALVQNHPDISEMIYFDRSALAGWCWKPSSAATLRTLVNQLRKATYDVVIDAQGLMRSALLAWASGAPVRIGPGDAREGAKFLYTHRVDSHRHLQLAVDRMRMLQTPLAPMANEVKFNLRADPVAADKIRSLLHTHQPYVVLLPAARWEAKIWSFDGYVQLGELAARNGLKIVILGSPAEEVMCSELASRIGAAALSLAGRTNLAEMIAVLEMAVAVVGNDTGPLHVAAALRRPLIGLYGPTDEKSVGPWGQPDHVLRFAPLADYRRSTDDTSDENLRRLPAEAVWKKLQELLHGQIKQP